MSKIEPSDLGIGYIFQHEGAIYKLLEKGHVKLSKGGACIKARCENLISRAIIDDMRLDVNITVERILVNKINLTYNYTQDDDVIFFDQDGNSHEFKIDDFGDIGRIFSSKACVEEMPNVEISLISYIDAYKDHEVTKVIDIRLLSSILVEVKDTRPSIKGQTAKASLKDAETKGNFKVSVPQYISNGDKIWCNYTSEGFLFFSKYDGK